MQPIIKLNQTVLNSSKTFQIHLDQIQKTLTLSDCCYIKWPSIEMGLSPFTVVPLKHSSDHYYWRYCRFFISFIVSEVEICCSILKLKTRIPHSFLIIHTKVSKQEFWFQNRLKYFLSKCKDCERSNFLEWTLLA